MSWFLNNLSTIVICAVLVLVIALIVRKLIKNKKQGKSSCGCGCQNCAMKDCCHSEK